MKKIELSILFFILIGLSFRFALIPGGGPLIGLGMGMLSIFYYVLSFALFNGIKLRNIFKKASYQHTNAKKIVGAIGLGISLSILIIGILFKLQGLPGATPMLTIGLLTTGLILIVASIFFLRNRTAFYKRVFVRGVVYFFLGALLYLTSPNTLIDIFHRDNPEYASILKQVRAHPEDPKLQQKLDSMVLEMRRKEVEETMKQYDK